MNMYLRSFHGPTDWGWVRQHLPLKRVEDTSGIVAVDLDAHATVAACVFDTWTDNSVQTHLVITNATVIRHGFFEEIADYVYNVTGRKLMIGLVPSNLKKVIEMDKKIGFQELVTIPDAISDGVGVVVLTMTKEQCRFYKPPPEPVEVPEESAEPVEET